MLANINLVPSPDMLGQPILPWISQLLMGLTLALHWSFLAVTMGGAVMWLLGSKGGSDGFIQAKKELSGFLPFSLSMAMTLGIAPLLFVQVLYGNFFYSSTIMIGWVWMGLLILMGINLYMLFIGRYQSGKGGSYAFVGLAVIGLMIASAFVLSSNATLSQNPGSWESFRANFPGKPYTDGATLAPRLALALCTLFAGGNLFAAMYLRLRVADDDQMAMKKISSKAILAIIGFVAALAAGAWASGSLTPAAKETLFKSGESVFVYGDIVLLGASLVLSVLSVSGKKVFLLAGSVSFFLSLLCLAYTRDTLRRIAISEHFDLHSIYVKNQWSSFILFLIVFILGLALVGYMVKLAMGDQKKLANA